MHFPPSRIQKLRYPPFSFFEGSAIFLHSWVRLHNNNTCKIDHGSRVGFFFFTAKNFRCRNKDAPLALPTGAAGTPPALPEFRLVSFALGAPQPLPLGLGDLPLYLDNDGFHSVNGPRDFAALPLCSPVTPVSHTGSAMIEASVTVISSLCDKKPCICPDHTHCCLDDVISRSGFITPICTLQPFLLYVHP